MKKKKKKIKKEVERKRELVKQKIERYSWMVATQQQSFQRNAPAVDGMAAI